MLNLYIKIRNLFQELFGLKKESSLESETGYEKFERRKSHSCLTCPKNIQWCEKVCKFVEFVLKIYCKCRNKMLNKSKTLMKI